MLCKLAASELCFASHPAAIANAHIAYAKQSINAHKRHICPAHGFRFEQSVVEKGISVIAEGIAVIRALAGAITGSLKLMRYMRSKPYTKPLAIFSEPGPLRDDLMRLAGRTVSFDTILDFSVWNARSNRIARETEYGNILAAPASALNKKSLPLYEVRPDGSLDTFVRLVVSVKDAGRLKFSHGGTGVIIVLLKGKFEVEVRHYSGPSVEFTLREIS